MHELGMVTGVVESVRQAAEANHADKVLKVSLSVGEMTEAIEDALTDTELISALAVSDFSSGNANILHEIRRFLV